MSHAAEHDSLVSPLSRASTGHCFHGGRLIPEPDYVIVSGDPERSRTDYFESLRHDAGPRSWVHGRGRAWLARVSQRIPSPVVGRVGAAPNPYLPDPGERTP